MLSNLSAESILYEKERGSLRQRIGLPIKIQLCDMDFMVLVEKYKFSLKLDDYNNSKL
jgi:hypothetical protein